MDASERRNYIFVPTDDGTRSIGCSGKIGEKKEIKKAT